MSEISSGWSELLAAVRRCEDGGPPSAPERQVALELAVSVGLATLPGAAGCSITRPRSGGGFVTPVAAGPVALALDEVQYTTDDGPCLRAARSGRPEQLDSLAADERWPELVRRAAELGVHSSLSLPLAEPASALNLYGAATGAFASAGAAARANMLGRAVSILLMDADQRPDDGLSAARVHRTLTERTLIARAQGVVMARYGVTQHVAYRKLAVRSGQESRPLRDVARQVLEAAESGRDGEDVSA